MFQALKNTTVNLSKKSADEDVIQRKVVNTVFREVGYFFVRLVIIIIKIVFFC